MACKPNSESLRCGAKYQMLVLIRKLNSSGFKSPAALLKRLTCLTHWGSESLALRLHWHSQWHTAQASANVRHWIEYFGTKTVYCGESSNCCFSQKHNDPPCKSAVFAAQKLEAQYPFWLPKNGHLQKSNLF